MNDIEKAVVEKCRSGDVEAFERLISDYQKKVFNLCYRYLENHDDASELAQEIFIKVYRSISTFKGESSISTWIYRIATTTCIDELRKRKGQAVVSIDGDDEGNAKIEIADNTTNPHDLLEKAEIKKEIKKAIGELPEEHKTVVVLRDIQGFSYDEISEIVGVPLGTVKSRIKRARSALKEYLLNKGNFFRKVSSE